MTLFDSLVETINKFAPLEPIIKEKQLEDKLLDYLKKQGFTVKPQVSQKQDRYDLICNQGIEKVCLELKIKTSPADIKQFDRYLFKFKDGMIIVCWQASLNLKELYRNVKKQSPIPIELIEVAKRYA